MFSDCCGYETTETELGICPQCLEHCDFEDDEDDEDELVIFNPALLKKLTKEQKALAFDYLSGSITVSKDRIIIQCWNNSINYAIKQLGESK